MIYFSHISKVISSFFSLNRDCDHSSKGGALRWMSWNVGNYREGDEVEKVCGQCGKTIRFIVGKFKENELRTH